MTHMTVKELVAAAYSAAPSLPPAEAKLMQDVASRLDVTYAILAITLHQNNEMAAEIEKLNGVNPHG